MSTDNPPQDTWAFRFAFFDANGAPNTQTYKTAFKALHWKDRIRLGVNFWAALFGPLYFLVLGLWKKALVLYGACILVVIICILLGVPESLLRGVGFGFQALFMIAANYAYYLKTVKKQDDWNPLDGMSWI